MKLTAQKTMQNTNSQMMSLFDENDICLGEIHKRNHAEHILKNMRHDVIKAMMEAIEEDGDNDTD